MVGAALVAALLAAGGVRPTVADTVASPNAAFPLTPATGYPAALGQVALRRRWSPFGITVDSAGVLAYDAVITVSGLPPASGGGYVAWLATPSLDRVERLGPIANGEPLVRPVSWNQLLVVVTLERADSLARWAGPTVLSGRSRSALIRPLFGHSLFRKTVF